MNHANISIVFFELSVATLAITFAVIAVAAVLRSGHQESALRPFVGRAIIPVFLVCTFTEPTGLYTEWIAVAIGFFDLALYVLGTAGGIVAIDIGHLFGFQLQRSTGVSLGAFLVALGILHRSALLHGSGAERIGVNHAVVVSQSAIEVILGLGHSGRLAPRKASLMAIALVSMAIASMGLPCPTYDWANK